MGKADLLHHLYSFSLSLSMFKLLLCKSLQVLNNNDNKTLSLTRKINSFTLLSFLGY